LIIRKIGKGRKIARNTRKLRDEEGRERAGALATKKPMEKQKKKGKDRERAARKKGGSPRTVTEQREPPHNASEKQHILMSYSDFQKTRRGMYFQVKEWRIKGGKSRRAGPGRKVSSKTN